MAFSESERRELTLRLGGHLVISTEPGEVVWLGILAETQALHGTQGPLMADDPHRGQVSD